MKSRQQATHKKTLRAAGIFLLAACGLNPAWCDGDGTPVKPFFPSGKNTYRLHCEWTGPTGSAQNMQFAEDAIIFSAPRGKVICRISVNGKTAKISRLEEKKLRSATGGHDFSPPAKGISFSAPELPGESRLDMTYIHNGTKKNFSLICQIPKRAVWSKGKYSTLSVGTEAHGRYPDPRRCSVLKVRENITAYEPPVFFGSVTPKNERYLVCPNIRLKNMVVANVKTGEKHSRNIPVNYTLLGNIEKLFDTFRDKGLPLGGVKILSLYRSPDYNRSVGSGSFSRHIYGDAIDFFFDADNDGKCDDLDGNGKLTRNDSLRVIDAVEGAQKSGALPAGGIGVYYANKKGLTFHLDFRGHRATWGYQYGRRGRSAFAWKSRYFAEFDAKDRAKRKVTRLKK